MSERLIIDTAMDKVPGKVFSDSDTFEKWIGCVPTHEGAQHVHVSELSDGRRQVSLELPDGFGNASLVEGEYSLEATLAAMDACGIEKAIIRIPVWGEWMTQDLCEMANDAYAEFAAASGGRIAAMGTVPPWGDKASLKELERCIKELGFCGIQLSAHYGTWYLDNEAFRPLLKVLNDEEIPVAVRNVPLPVDYGSITKYNNVRRELGREIDAITAVSLELYSGIFEDFPNLKFVHGFMGGAWFAFDGLLRPKVRAGASEETKRFDTDAAERIERYVQNNLFFEITHPGTWGKKQLECAIEVCGADKYVFGTMIPVFDGQGDIDAIDALDIPESDKELILGGNAKRIFGL